MSLEMNLLQRHDDAPCWQHTATAAAYKQTFILYFINVYMMTRQIKKRLTLKGVLLFVWI